MIKMALPNKGQLFEPTMELLKSCGYRVSKSARALSCIDSENGMEFYFLRPGDIPMYVGQGILDVGITGQDFNAEKRSAAIPMLDLQYGASRLCAAAPVSAAVKDIQELKNKRIATSFPSIVKSYFEKEDIEIVELEGAVEISVNLGIADAVVDVVSTGTTLKQAGLEIIGEPLFHSSAALFAHPGRDNASEILTLVKRVEGRLVATSYMMVEYDVPATEIEKACAMTPGLESPTVTPLQKPDWFSVKAMVKKGEANRVMDGLAGMGCKGILLTRIETARI